MPGNDGGPSLSLRRSGTRVPAVKACRALSLNADIDPAPTPWPFAPALACLVVLFFVALQIILPATHARHPLDPYRTWIPINEFKARANDKIGLSADNSWSSFKGSKGNLIVVMTKEDDLRPTFVVLNSTISNTRMEPEKLQFCVVIPSSVGKAEILKLKAVFSNVKIEIISDKLVIEKLKPLIPSEITSEKSFKLLDLVPFYLPMMLPSYSRFVCLDSDSVLQGDILELIEVDMQVNPVAGVKDCTLVFDTFFAMNLLEAARLSSGNGKPHMPLQPYGSKTCLFDTGTLVIDQNVWRESNITEAVHWWIAMHSKTAENLYSNGHVQLPVQLALYQKYKALNASWNVREPLNFAKASAGKLIHFDKQHKPWHQTKPTNFEKDVTALWWRYLSPPTNLMFNTQ